MDEASYDIAIAIYDIAISQPYDIAISQPFYSLERDDLFLFISIYLP